MDYKIIDGVYKGPEHYEGDVDLYGIQVKDLGCLKSVGGDLDLEGSQVTDLGCLKSVGRYLDLRNSQITSLGNLKTVGRSLYLPDGTQVENFEAYKEEAEQLTVEDYPLHMNSKNWIVRSKVNKFLETGEL